MAARTSVLAQSRIPRRREFLTPVHSALNVLHVLATHALLIGWLVLGYALLPFAIYVPATLLACLIHQRAMSEWIHEGAHANFVGNRAANDWLTDALAGVWFLLPVRTYRAVHLRHHRQQDFFVAEDPDTAFLDVESRRAFWLAIARDVSGVTMVGQFRRFRTSGRGQHAIEWLVRGVSAVALGVLAIFAYRAGRLDALILYYVALVTLYPLHNRLRTYGQHVTIGPDGASTFLRSDTSRTIDAGMLDQIVHTSPRLMYHNEHHRYPQLPYRALRGITVPTDDVNRYATSRWRVLRAVYSGLPATTS